MSIFEHLTFPTAPRRISVLTGTLPHPELQHRSSSQASRPHVGVPSTKSTPTVPYHAYPVPSSILAFVARNGSISSSVCCLKAQCTRHCPTHASLLSASSGSSAHESLLCSSNAASICDRRAGVTSCNVDATRVVGQQPSARERRPTTHISLPTSSQTRTAHSRNHGQIIQRQK